MSGTCLRHRSIPMKRIVLAEDHALLRYGLRMLLTSERDLEIVAETGDGAAVTGLVGVHRPDLLVLDLGLPGRGGVEIAREIRLKFDSVKILVLTGNARPDAVRTALAAGADGYVLKVDDNAEIVPAIRAVLGGGIYVGESIAKGFVQGRVSAGIGAVRITPREQEILRRVADGLGNQQIADALHISIETVRTHRKNAMEKLELRNAAEITAYVINEGLGT